MYETLKSRYVSTLTKHYDFYVTCILRSVYDSCNKLECSCNVVVVVGCFFL